jgi:hypothetical protein
MRIRSGVMAAAGSAPRATPGLSHAGQLARVGAERGMTGRLERGDQA